MKMTPHGRKLLERIKVPAMPLEEAEWIVRESVQVDLHPNQFSALVCFVTCRGESAFLRSILLKRVNEKDHFAAAAQFARWNRSGGKERKQLTKRRRAERELYMTPAIVVMNGG